MMKTKMILVGAMALAALGQAATVEELRGRAKALVVARPVAGECTYSVRL